MSVPKTEDVDAEAAAAVVFTQKRKASEVCKKGTDGSGYIEGKMFDKGKMGAGKWEFSIMDTGYRVHISLSGSISLHLSDIPVAVGALVRCDLRGLVLEDIPKDQIKPGSLPKRFLWQDGIMLLVKNTKKNQTAFLDTWKLSGTSPQAHTSTNPEAKSLSPSTVLKKRPRTPTRSPPSPTFTSDTRNRAASCPSGSGVLYDASVDTSEPMDVDPAPDAAVVSTAQAAQSFQGAPISLPEMKLTGASSSRGSATGQPDVPPPKPLPPDGGARTEHSGRSTEQLNTGDRNSESPTKRSRKQLRRDGKKKRKFAASSAAKASPSKLQQGAVDEDDEQYLWECVGPEIPYDELDDIGQRGVANTPIASPVNHSADTTPEAENTARTAEDQAQVADDIAQAASNTTQAADDAAQVLEDPPHTHPEPAQEDAPLINSSQEASVFVYTPLGQFRGSKTYNIMGVVSGPSSVSNTRTGEFMFRVFLYDQSNFETNGLGVSLFEKTDSALPKVETGDVLILRMITCDNYSQGVGASYRGWQWAVFRPATGKVLSAPETSNGSQRAIKPMKSELLQCIAIGDWWRDVNANNVTFGPREAFSVKGVRQHKLMRDATEGFFDCTVEIHHSARISEYVFVVYVTDYTRNHNVAPTQGSWCPEKLAGVILLVEFSHSAYDVAATMQVGEYYSIRNMRLKFGSGGYLEGRVQEGHKITKLDEDDLENQQHFSDLLKRKIEWETMTNISGGVHEFPHQLIEDAKEDCHFNCTVEIVYISDKENMIIYVTDYTARTDLAPVAATIAPTALTGRIVRIVLSDAQVETGKQLAPGDFVAIRNLRLRTTCGTLLSGRLGGDQRLITKLNPKKGGNAELNALLARKRDFEGASVSEEQARSGKGGTAARAARKAAAAEAAEARAAAASSSKPVVKHQEKLDGDQTVAKKHATKEQQHVLLSDVKASEACPAVFRVRVRAVDFYPDDLRRCVIFRCTSCEKTLPSRYRICPSCDDAMEDETSVQGFFQLYFRISDENGETLDVDVSDERCSILHDLAPDEVSEDEQAFSMFVARVKPLLGELLDASNGEARRRPIAQDENGEVGPWLDMTVGSWLPAAEPDAPETRMYMVLQHSEI